MFSYKRKNIIGMASLVFLFFVFVFAANTFADQPRYGGILKISQPYENRGLGYPPTVKQTEIRLVSACVETLLRVDEKGRVSPSLAESWKYDPQQKTLTLNLRKGVKFHDMTDFNAEAVKYNMTVIFSKQNSVMINVDEVLVPDEYTIVLRLKKWSNDILPYLGMKWGLIISPDAYKKHGADWCNSHPVGTGPFKFVSWQRDVMHKFERFDHYWQKGKPYLDGIEWHIVVDPVTQLAAFRDGEHHIMTVLDTKDARQLENTGKYKIISLPGGFQLISGDGIHPESPWSKVKVRQAMMHAIDRESIAAAVGSGYWGVSPRHQLAREGTWEDNPDVKGYPYNPEKARQLLAEAGYPNGFKTSLLTINKPQYIVSYMTAIQNQLIEVGIDASLELLDTGKEFQINVGGSWDNALMWVPNSASRGGLITAYNQYKPTAHMHKCTARPADYQALLEKAMTEPDTEISQEIFRESQKLFVDKYAISNVLFLVPTMAAKYPSVHDDLLEYHEFFWHPENAWLSE